MNEIYVIVSGQYSDWNIEGYTTDREKAELICCYHNHLPDDEKDWLYGNWYVMSVDEADFEGDIKGSVYWNYKFVFWKSEYGWQNYSDVATDDYVKCDNKAEMPSVDKCYNRDIYRRVLFSNTRFLSYEEAHKVAYDMLMQNLAAELLG